MSINLFQLRRRIESDMGKGSLFLLAKVVRLLPRQAALSLGRSLGRVVPGLSVRHYRRVQYDIAMAFPNARAEEIGPAGVYQPGREPGGISPPAVDDCHGDSSLGTPGG